MPHKQTPLIVIIIIIIMNIMIRRYKSSSRFSHCDDKGGSGAKLEVVENHLCPKRRFSPGSLLLFFPLKFWSTWIFRSVGNSSINPVPDKKASKETFVFIPRIILLFIANWSEFKHVESCALRLWLDSEDIEKYINNQYELLKHWAADTESCQISVFRSSSTKHYQQQWRIMIKG